MGTRQRPAVFDPGPGLTPRFDHPGFSARACLTRAGQVKLLFSVSILALGAWNVARRLAIFLAAAA